MAARTASPAITTAQEFDRIIATTIQMGEGFRVPILRAARDGLLCLAAGSAGQALPSICLKQKRPTLVLLADDLPTSPGVEGWPQARKLLRWARAAIFHASGGQEMHYALAVASTLEVGRVLFVEMEHRHHAGWLALAKHVAPRLPVLNIVPPPGGQHPIMSAPAGEVVQ